MSFACCSDCKTPVGCGIRKECATQQPPAAAKPVTAVVSQEPAHATAPQEAPKADPGISVDAPVQATLAPVEGAASGAPSAAEAFIASRRLCKDCKFASKPLGRAVRDSNCKHPDLPINLVDGGRIFPCVIARGYKQLCGPLAARWVYNG